MTTLRLLFLTASLLFTTNLNPSQEPPELQEASTLTASALKLYNQGKYDEALPLVKRALEIREKLLPRTDGRLSSSLSTLAEVYIAKKDYKAAREVFQRILQIDEEQFGPDNVNLANTLDRVASLYFAEGSSRNAEKVYKQALALREQKLGPNDVLVARTLFSLGELYRAQKDLKAALPAYKRALSIYGQQSGSRSPDFERVSDGFRCVIYEQEKPELFKELEAAWKQCAGPDALGEPQPAGVLNNQALSLPKPDYPVTAAQRSLVGLVVVKVTIDESGNVIKAKDLCQGPPLLRESAVAAAWNARFKPTTLNGQAVKVTGVLQYKFMKRPD